jgi:hypothetical protein
MTYAKTSQFAVSSLGQILTYIVYALRDVATTLTIIVLNVLNLIYLKKHLNKKNIMLKRASIFVPQQDQVEQSNASKRKESNVASKGTVKKNKSKEESVDRKASLMVLVMCSITTISNSLFISAIIYFYFNIGATANLFGQFAEYCYLLKSSTQIIVFYSFNSIFRTKLRKILRLEGKK